MNIPNTPLFVKTQDFMIWLIRHSLRFPKALRHSYTIKLETLAMEFQEAILMANAVRGEERRTWLDRADGKLQCVRAMLRIALELEFLSRSQVLYASGLVDELGRLLGAWKKGTGR